MDQVDRRSRLNACIASTPVDIFGLQSIIDWHKMLLAHGNFEFNRVGIGLSS